MFGRALQLQFLKKGINLRMIIIMCLRHIIAIGTKINYLHFFLYLVTVLHLPSVRNLTVPYVTVVRLMTARPTVQ